MIISIYLTHISVADNGHFTLGTRHGEGQRYLLPKIRHASIG